jgi:3-hydroxyisobutyrate dehydrogenase
VFGKVAVIGLGNIGGGAARNLIRAGYQGWGSDLDQTILDDLISAGGKAATSAVDAAQESHGGIT